MFRRISLVILTLLTFTLATASAAHAQDEEPERFDVLALVGDLGDSELMIQGATSISLDDVEGGNTGSILASWGWFFTENQQVGAKTILVIRDDAKGDLDLGGAGGPFYRYNFLTGEIAPFVGASLLASFGDYRSGDVSLEIEGGVRWFLSRNLAFSVAGSIDYDVDEHELDDRLGVVIGLSYFWR
jgi:hypothetical protein